MRNARLAVGGAVLVAAGLLGSTAAFGLPWDVDMVDSQFVRAYEQTMRPLPDGVVAQPRVESPKSYQPVYSQVSAEANALVSPLDDSPEVRAQGEKMFKIYCASCHGDGVTLGPVAQPGRVPAVAVLAGPNGRLPNLSDGRIYMTIRQGSPSTLMPAHGYMMTEREQWSIVHYLRTLNNGAYKPPAPAPAEAPAGTNP